MWDKSCFFSPPLWFPHPSQAISTLKTLLPKVVLVWWLPLLFVCLGKVGTIKWEEMCWSGQSCHSSEDSEETIFWHLKNAHSLWKVGVPVFPVSQMPTIKGKMYHTTWVKLSLFSMTYTCLQYNIWIQEAWWNGTYSLIFLVLWRHSAISINSEDIIVSELIILNTMSERIRLHVCNNFSFLTGASSTHNDILSSFCSE